MARLETNMGFKPRKNRSSPKYRRLRAREGRRRKRRKALGGANVEGVKGRIISEIRGRTGTRGRSTPVGLPADLLGGAKMYKDYLR
jgi:hypothetical protein